MSSVIESEISAGFPCSVLLRARAVDVEWSEGSGADFKSLRKLGDCFAAFRGVFFSGVVEVEDMGREVLVEVILREFLVLLC